jgi:hypothetical protein
LVNPDEGCSNCHFCIASLRRGFLLKLRLSLAWDVSKVPCEMEMRLTLVNLWYAGCVQWTDEQRALGMSMGSNFLLMSLPSTLVSETPNALVHFPSMFITTIARFPQS